MTEIKFNLAPTAADCDLFVDGERVTRVQSVDVHAGVGERTTLRVVRHLDAPALAEGSIKAEDLTITEVCREAIDHLDAGVLAYRRSLPAESVPSRAEVALREVRDLLMAEWGHADAEYRPAALDAIARANEALGE